LFEEAAVAEGHLILGSYAQFLRDVVDPVRWAFQFCEGSDGGFVYYTVTVAVGPLGAPLFVAKDGDEADGGEDLGEGGSVGELGFGFDAVLVAIFTDTGIGYAFVGEKPAAVVAADADQFAFQAQGAVGSVVEDVALEATGSDEMEADRGQVCFQLCRAGDAELDFCFDRCHCPEYTIRSGVETARLRVDNRSMPTLRLRVDPDRMDEPEAQRAMEQAASILRGGGTVALPTETVYGLGANALDAEAVAAIFRAKERPGWDPLIVHVADEAMLDRVAIEVSERARLLMRAFWPGPLTLLLPRSAQVPDAVTAGRPLVGVRMPGHPVALEVIRRAGVPVAAPSANRFGHTSPTTAGHVLEDLDGRIDAVVDAGPTALGVESTVLDPSVSPIVIYRPGAVTLEQVREVAGATEMFVEQDAPAVEPREALPSPGVGLRHYAPKARLILMDVDNGAGSVNLASRLLGLAMTLSKERVGVMLPNGLPGEQSVAESKDHFENLAEIFWWGQWSEPEELAQRLFAGLRQLDAAGCTVILCPMPAGRGICVAIRDRLRKAAWVPAAKA